MYSRFPWSLTMTFPQTVRTTFIGELSFFGRMCSVVASLSLTWSNFPPQNWSRWPFWQKRSCYQLCDWGGQEDSSWHWDVLQYNRGGDAYECGRPDLSPEIFLFVLNAVIAIVHLHCAYYSRGKKNFSMLNLRSEFWYVLKARWLLWWSLLDSCRFWPWQLIGWSCKAMGSISIKVLIRYFFPCSLKMRVFDVLHHLVTYLWTKRYKCCIKSANYVMLTYVRCIVGLLNRGFCHVIL